MTIVKLPNGRYRARIWHDKRDVPVGRILGTGPVSYRTKGDAKDAYAEARKRLRAGRADHDVVSEREPLRAKPLPIEGES